MKEYHKLAEAECLIDEAEKAIEQARKEAFAEAATIQAAYWKDEVTKARKEGYDQGMLDQAEYLKGEVYIAQTETRAALLKEINAKFEEIDWMHINRLDYTDIKAILSSLPQRKTNIR